MKFNKSVEEDKFLQKLQRIYNLMHSRFYRFEEFEYIETENNISKEKFKGWMAVALKARQNYKTGKISGEKIINIISENFE